MNEASRGRFALAQQLAPHYSASPKVAAVAVAGSVARWDAVRFSDIDLAVFWVAAPTERERREISKHARGRHVRGLSMAMVRAHLRFRPAWEQEKLVERSDLPALYESFCAVEKQILLVLMGLNRLYYPGWQWVDRLMAQMRIAPLKLAPRLKQLFGIVSIDPLASAYQLHDLVEETFRLVETHLSELDTAQALARFQVRRQTWEGVPDGLMEEA